MPKGIKIVKENSHPMFDAADAILAERGQEYNKGPITRQSYFTGPTDHAFIIRLKAQRLYALLWSMDHRELKKEDVKDKIAEHLSDLVNYSRFCWDDFVGDGVPNWYDSEATKE